MPGIVVWQVWHETPWPLAKTGMACALGVSPAMTNANAHTERMFMFLKGRRQPKEYASAVCNLGRVKAVGDLDDVLVIQQVVHRQIEAERFVSVLSGVFAQRYVRGQVRGQPALAALELHRIAGAVLALQRCKPG